MIERMIVVLFLYTILLSYDLSRLKKQPKQIRYIYTIIIVLSFYLSFDFILDAQLPNIIDLINSAFLKPAEQIVNYLTIE